MMLKPRVVFEENKLSDTVVEFKIAKVDKLHPLYVVALSLLLCISVWGILRDWIFIQFLCVVALFSMILVMKYSVKEESIIIIKNFGIQLRAKYLFGSEKTDFLDTDRIDGVLIHEYVHGSQVNYSLAFLVKGQKNMSLLFKHLYPGFEKLREVYWACKNNM